MSLTINSQTNPMLYSSTKSNALSQSSVAKNTETQSSTADSSTKTARFALPAGVQQTPLSATANATAFPDLFGTSNLNFLALGSQLKPINVAELPKEEYQQYVEREQARIEANRMMLEQQYTTEEHPVPGSLPQTKTYAEVLVNGKVVASIDNQGVITTDKALSESVLSQLPDSSSNGPELAQARAERLAQLFGGEVKVADTALTQLQFNALPTEVIKRTLNETAMKADPAYAMLQTSIENLMKLQQQRQQAEDAAVS